LLASSNPFCWLIDLADANKNDILELKVKKIDQAIKKDTINDDEQ